jgi:hypothetical protein
VAVAVAKLQTVLTRPQPLQAAQAALVFRRQFLGRQFLMQAVVAGVVRLLVVLAALAAVAMVVQTLLDRLEQQTLAVVAAVLVLLALQTAAMAAQALSSFATSLALLVLRPLLRQAARLQPLVNIRSTRSTPVELFKSSAEVAMLNTLLLPVAVRAELTVAVAVQVVIALP